MVDRDSDLEAEVASVGIEQPDAERFGFEPVEERDQSTRIEVVTDIEVRQPGNALACDRLYMEPIDRFGWYKFGIVICV